MKTVIEMAKESGFVNLADAYWDCTTKGIQRFAELVRADERNSWPAEMEAMERQVNILTDALAEQPAQRTWVGLMRGVRVEGDTVVITAKGGNDAARELCGALLEEKNT